jgi:hypothetical protein
MADKIKKKCTTPSCATVGIPIETELENCISCGNTLSPDINELFAKIFGTRSPFN